MYQDYKLRLPLTLERHFERLAGTDSQIRELYSTWILFKEQVEEELLQSRNVFSTFSLHDASHSRSIIQALERLLGEDRIIQLGATDVFMLLVCTYAHDYGMAYTVRNIYDTLGSSNFRAYMEQLKTGRHMLEAEDAWALENIMSYLNCTTPRPELKDIYFSIILLLQMYLRPEHWKGVMDLDECLQGLFKGRINKRFFHGMEGIIEVCMSHGQSMKEIFCLSECADGMVGDDYHPRFIAAMLRLGDLLDIDNNRFPRWFVREVSRDRDLIPQLSIMHYWKHESISHLRIAPDKIEITADCRLDQGGYKVADLVSEWTDWLADECQGLAFHWNEIAPPNFGRPPAKPKIEIYVNHKLYFSGKQTFQMQMPQERVMELLEGANIYNDKYAGIREMVQNAVDASLLQLWYDVLQNRYRDYGLSRHTGQEGLDVMDLNQRRRAEIFGNYDITIELIQDFQEKCIYLVVKDKGIGIVPSDMEYIANIGSDKAKNQRHKEIIDQMPDWLKPAGTFGIGLQSIFQLTDRIEFYTRQPNSPEMKITFHSYGKSRGKIEMHEVPPNEDGLFYDNAVPGTNVKIAISPDKFFRCGDTKTNPDSFTYYDTEFDAGGELDMIFAELGKVIESKVKEIRYDYFNIDFQAMTKSKEGELHKEDKRHLRRSYFCPQRMDAESGRARKLYNDSALPLLKNQEGPYDFTDSSACFWDRDTKRVYRLSVRPCRIVDKVAAGIEHRQVYLPEPVSNLYHVSYKFCPINDADSIYSPNSRPGRLHAGFLEWSILIFDTDSRRYLNIDKEHLKEDAIHEEELLQVRRTILNLWCEYLIEKDASRGKTAKAGTGNRFQNTPGTLLSLIFLFYQNVSLSRFSKFMETYQDFVEDLNLVLGNEKVPITCLWDGKQRFQASVPLPAALTNPGTAQETEDAIVLKPETLTYLPHRLVQIEKISQGLENDLVYRLHLRVSGNWPTEILMDDAARLFDYMSVFEPYSNQPHKTDYLTVQKTLFKPNAEFPSLLLPCYPRTFRKGKNFSSSLDYCIRWYILSPFDREAAQILKRGIKTGEAIQNELLTQVTQSAQFNKCVRYILNKRYGDLLGKERERKETAIRQEYIAFIRDFCRIVCENRELIENQFSERKPSS